MTDSLHITSRQNPRVKDAARLRDAKERQRTGRFIIDGSREIVRAIESGLQPLEAFVCDELCTSADSRQAEGAVRGSPAEVFRVSAEVYEKLAFGERLDGVVVVAEQAKRELGDLTLPAGAIVAVIEGVEKPGNVGAVLRSADAAGIDAVIVADGRTDLYNPNTIRASLGTVFRANVCEATTTETIAWLRAQGLPIVATRPDAAQLYTEFDFRPGAAIVLGSEAVGLSDAWNAADITPIRLPMRGIADSLNVSTTAAVLFYEALRQRE